MTSRSCRNCKEEKNIEEFFRNKNKKGGYKTICKECEKVATRRTEERRKLAGDLRYFSGKIVKGMERRAKKKGFLCEFTSDDVETVLKDKKCAVTNRSFQVKNATQYRANPFIASPDRIDTKKGYTKDNVRWVMWWVNKCRGEYEIEFFENLIRGVKW